MKEVTLVFSNNEVSVFKDYGAAFLFHKSQEDSDILTVEFADNYMDYEDAD